LQEQQFRMGEERRLQQQQQRQPITRGYTEHSGMRQEVGSTLLERARAIQAEQQNQQRSRGGNGGSLLGSKQAIEHR
jgi:hypothetical protein